MKRKHLLGLAFLALTAFTSCGNKTEKLQQEADSLKSALQQRNQDYSNLQNFVSVISESLNAINAQENTIIRTDPEKTLPDREQMKQSLVQLKETLQQQRDRIEQLEKEVSTGNADATKLKTIIEALKQQMVQKDEQISNLMAQLEKSNLTTVQLSQRIGKLTQQTSEQADRIAQQEEVMQAQDQILNEGYIKMGTKKELKEAGLLSGGFLKKTKVNYSNINLDLFQKIDIREVTNITIPSKSPKILTNIPAGSYTLQQEGQSTILVISDPTSFWSVSNFLIIQTK